MNGDAISSYCMGYQGELGCSPLTVATLHLIQTSSLLGWDSFGEYPAWAHASHSIQFNNICSCEFCSWQAITLSNFDFEFCRKYFFFDNYILISLHRRYNIYFLYYLYNIWPWNLRMKCRIPKFLKHMKHFSKIKRLFIIDYHMYISY